MNHQRKPNYLFIGTMSVFLGHVIFSILMVVWAFLLGKFSADPYAPLLAFLVMGFIGITQLVYVIPLILWLKHKRKFDMMKGAIIGAVFTVLLNGSCYILVMVTSSF